MQPSNSHVTPATLRGLQTQRALLDQASTWTWNGMGEHDLAYLVVITGSRSQTNAPAGR
jgi:hypothetical protein